MKQTTTVMTLDAFKRYVAQRGARMLKGEQGKVAYQGKDGTMIVAVNQGGGQVKVIETAGTCAC